MPYYTPLYQGEGISGPAGVGAGTGPLYSCIGIAFVNQRSRVGGLYHYPANTLNIRVVQDAITQMVREIEPDQIVVTPALDTGGTGSTSVDVGSVTSFLQNLSPNANVERADAAVSAHLVWNGNQPVFNQPPHQVSEDYDSDTSLGEHELRAQRSSLPRQLEDNVLYYGVDGERNSQQLASQTAGAATGSSQAASSGRPRFKKGSRRKWIRDRCLPM